MHIQGQTAGDSEPSAIVSLDDGKSSGENYQPGSVGLANRWDATMARTARSEVLSLFWRCFAYSGGAPALLIDGGPLEPMLPNYQGPVPPVSTDDQTAR